MDDPEDYMEKGKEIDRLREIADAKLLEADYFVQNVPCCANCVFSIYKADGGTVCKLVTNDTQVVGYVEETGICNKYLTLPIDDEEDIF